MGCEIQGIPLRKGIGAERENTVSPFCIQQSFAPSSSFPEGGDERVPRQRDEREEGETSCPPPRERAIRFL